MSDFTFTKEHILGDSFHVSDAEIRSFRLIYALKEYSSEENQEKARTGIPIPDFDMSLKQGISREMNEAVLKKFHITGKSSPVQNIIIDFLHKVVEYRQKHKAQFDLGEQVPDFDMTNIRLPEDILLKIVDAFNTPEETEAMEV